MNDYSIYDEDYYLRGVQTGKSLYVDYKWLPHLTIPMCQAIVSYLRIKKHETVLDFGCARGYTVKALRIIGYDAYGIDASEWAVANADEEVRKYLRRSTTVQSQFHWILAKDVLEHVEEAAQLIANLQHYSNGVFAVVPLAAEDCGPYVFSDYEKDKTHVHRLTLASWVRMFLRRGWDVTASYRVPGIKDNHYITGFEPGDGFIIARRVQ